MNNQLVGFGYDASGNMTANGGYVYDGENRLVWTSGYRYVYDGNGERVEKCQAASATTACPTSGTNGKLYWKGTGSDPLAESDLAGTPQEEYIFFNGTRIARRDVSSTGATIAMHYYFSDHLGTHAVVENATGTQNEQDIDYYPYGGQQNDYSTTPVAQNYKFTGKERDAESGLDNFGARYNASTMGRFMTPDPLLNSGRPWNPQTWNRYSYARNNPLSIVDPTGLYDLNNTCAGDDKKCNKQFQQHANDLKKGLENLQKKVDKMKDGTEKTRLGNSLTALGTEGDHNGVNVAFGATKDGSAATTDPVFDQSSGKYSGFNVTIDPSKESNGANGYAIDERTREPTSRTMKTSS